MILLLATPSQIQAGKAREVLARSGPLVIAHRGASGHAPENTLPAFRLALATRADLVELDYYHSADGVPVVFHDTTLDRTTDATNRWGGQRIAVGSRSAAALMTLDAGAWFNPVYEGTRIPTLVEATETIQAGGCTLIERKAGDAATLVRLLEEHDWLDDVVVQSFDWTFVRDARALAPNLILGALGPPSRWAGRDLTREERVLSGEFIDAMEAAGADVVVWNSQVTAEAIRLAQDRGFPVWIYTINQPDEAQRLIDLGADGIITDFPQEIRARLLPEADEAASTVPHRAVPLPLPEHPGNIYLEGQTVSIVVPEGVSEPETAWRLYDDSGAPRRSGTLAAAAPGTVSRLDMGRLGIGWYRLEFGPPEQPLELFTTAAVLGRLQAPTPADSPVCVDSAASWFALDDAEGQRRLARFAALAGVNWVRDRLRWRDLQPEDGPLKPGPTTYDTAARIQHEEGLKVLQVFHDTPPWARETPTAGGRFAPDLRHVHRLAGLLAGRFQGVVQAWEPWNEGNVATFGAHTVDQLCAWQKAAWLGFKSADPELLVGWNVTTGVPTDQQTDGLLANEVWPYTDTYNIHTYDWSHAYAELWQPARRATSGRPLWITEADRGTPHLKRAPFFDQDPRLERLKAEWIAQSYATSLFAGARRHFHFILGHYHEPNEIQFGLLRLDLTPRPAYVALAAVGRYLAGARVLGRWRPAPDVHVYAFQAQPDGVTQDVLAIWAERDVDWDGRGQTRVNWNLPEHLQVRETVDYLGRSLSGALPSPLTSAPVFVLLPAGQATTLPLEPPPPLAPWRTGAPSPLVLQLELPRAATVRVEDLPWSEGYAYQVTDGEPIELTLHLYNFATEPARGQLKLESAPAGWDVTLPSEDFELDPRERQTWRGRVRVPADAAIRDGWIRVRAESGALGRPVLAFRVIGTAP